MRVFLKQSNFSLRVVMPACHIDHLIETQQGNSGSSLMQCHLALCTTVSSSPPLSLGACQFQLASFNFHWFRSLGSTFHLSTRFIISLRSLSLALHTWPASQLPGRERSHQSSARALVQQRGTHLTSCPGQAGTWWTFLRILFYYKLCLISLSRSSCYLATFFYY